MDNNLIQWKIEDSIGHIILNNPPKNIMGREFFNEFNKIIRENARFSKVEAIILYSSGRHFSAGADLSDLLDPVFHNNDDKINEFFFENSKVCYCLKESEIPFIAAISGVCFGAAFELALSCDFRIATTNALFSFPEVSFNLIPGCGGIQNILPCITSSKAMELILTGQSIDSQMAKSLNIITKIVHKKELLNEAVSFAKKVTKRIKSNFL